MTEKLVFVGIRSLKQDSERRLSDNLQIVNLHTFVFCCLIISFVCMRVSIEVLKIVLLSNTGKYEQISTCTCM